MFPWVPSIASPDIATTKNPRWMEHVPLKPTFSPTFLMNHHQTSSASSHRPDGDSSYVGNEESCRPCFYTGLATCTALTGYFLYLATDPQNLKHKKFLLAGSSAWALAGCYRFYLN